MDKHSLIFDGVVVERGREREVFSTKRTGRKPVGLLFVYFPDTRREYSPAEPAKKIEFVTAPGPLGIW